MRAGSVSRDVRALVRPLALLLAAALAGCAPAGCARPASVLPENRLAGAHAFEVRSAYVMGEFPAAGYLVMRAATVSCALAVAPAAPPDSMLMLGLGADPLRGGTLRTGDLPDGGRGWWPSLVFAPSFAGGPLEAHAVGTGAVSVTEVSRRRVVASFDLELTTPLDGGNEGHLLGAFSGEWCSEPQSAFIP